MCLIGGYYIAGIHKKDRNKIRRLLRAAENWNADMREKIRSDNNSTLLKKRRYVQPKLIEITQLYPIKPEKQERGILWYRQVL